jgi:hypothetical protein
MAFSSATSIFASFAGNVKESNGTFCAGKPASKLLWLKRKTSKTGFWTFKKEQLTRFLADQLLHLEGF